MTPRKRPSKFCWPYILFVAVALSWTAFLVFLVCHFVNKYW